MTTTGPAVAPQPRGRLRTAAHLARRPRVRALLLYVGYMLTTFVAGLAVKAIVPHWSGTAQSLVTMIPLVVLVTVLVMRFGGWHAAGFTPPRQWRDLRLLVLPALLVFTPLVAGFAPVEPGLLTMLVVGYALTGFMEEAMWRGVIPHVLRPTGVLSSALLGSALFGAAHLSNILFRENPALVASQAVGAFCFGVGYAALRHRTGTIWPLMVLHMATDLFAATGAVPKIPILVAQDVILLVFGLILLRRPRTPANDAAPP
ncbi:CPBP family intramembrane glutamic endopeptidase [Sphaerisporangium sp. NPDC049003]|uniref:CPBP family intramembrane glutamic endopeptidase n=1 Tax=Sphaerisporangium sp. NPDC049003 TaxID=3364517 RepID=UPI003720EF37